MNLPGTNRSEAAARVRCSDLLGNDTARPAELDLPVLPDATDFAGLELLRCRGRPRLRAAPLSGWLPNGLELSGARAGKGDERARCGRVFSNRPSSR